MIRMRVLGDKKYIYSSSILLHISYRCYLLTTMLASVQNTNSLSISNRKDNVIFLSFCQIEKDNGFWKIKQDSFWVLRLGRWKIFGTIGNGYHMTTASCVNNEMSTFQNRKISIQSCWLFKVTRILRRPHVKMSKCPNEMLTNKQIDMPQVVSIIPHEEYRQ